MKRMAAFAVAVLVGLTLTPALATQRIVHAAPTVEPQTLDLVSQEFNLSDGDLFVALVALAPRAGIVDGSIVVTSYARIATRSAVADAIDGELTRPVDRVEVPLATAVQPEADQYLVELPIEAIDRADDALQFSRPGLYPVTIEIRSGDATVADLTTFVNRLTTTSGEDEPSLSIAAAMTADDAVSFSPAGGERVLDVATGDTVLAASERLADILEASPIPVAVRVSPAVLGALPEPERLAAALDQHLLLSATKYPLDPSAAAAAGQQALYTQWYRNGEDELARVVTNPSVRTVAFVDRPLSAAGGVLQRDLGTRLALITPTQLDALPGSLGPLTDTTRLVDLTLAPNIVVPAAVVDRTNSQRLDSGTDDPALTAVEAVADLLAARQEILDSGGDPSRHCITLATPDLTLPDPDTFLAIADLVSMTTGLAPVELDSLVVRVDSAQRTEDAPPVRLPDAVDGSITARVGRAQSLSTEIQHVRSMLPTTGDAATVANRMVGAWNRLAGLLPSSAITDSQADTIVASVTDDLTEIRNAVVLPSGFSFTLTGRSSTVPIKLENTSDMPLTVQVRVTSLKLLFPDGPQIVTLEPGQFTEVMVAIEARSNGKSPVTLEVYTPDNGVRLGPPVPLSVRVTALSGLGNLLTGAFIIVLLTWWVRHVRQNRRAKAALLAAQRHPGAGAASTLPPS